MNTIARYPLDLRVARRRRFLFLQLLRTLEVFKANYQHGPTVEWLVSLLEPYDVRCV
jgi:hypothetical protein